MTTVVITPADGEPVSADAVKDYLRIGHEGEDALISRLIAGARARIEKKASLAIVSRGLRMTLSRWPQGVLARALPLRPGPVQALDAVRIGAVDRTERFELAGDDLRLKPYQSLPQPAEGETIEIDFTAGFGAAADTPDALAHAVVLLAAHAYQRRETGEGGADGLPGEVSRLISSYREARL